MYQFVYTVRAVLKISPVPGGFDEREIPRARLLAIGSIDKALVVILYAAKSI